MTEANAEETIQVPGRVFTSVLLFWVGYLIITLVVGFATAMLITSEVWQLAAWGFVSSLGLLALPRLLGRLDPGAGRGADAAPRVFSLAPLTVGLLIGVASFGLHVFIVATFAGPLRFEWVSGVGFLAALIYFARFLATSCMEEIGFRGYALRRLTLKIGSWPAVCVTAVVFGLSHLSYGWDLQTIALGVVPGGLLWGMSALATRGLAVPIGLHAAWNFTSWSVGGRAETGLLRMILDEGAVERSQQVGTVSYLSIFGVLTIGFWLLHRRNTAREGASGTSGVSA